MSSPATSLRQLLVPHAHHWLENESGREHGGAPEPQPQRVEGEGVEGRDAEAEDGGECRDEGVEGGEEEMEGGGGGQQQERDGECEGGHHQLSTSTSTLRRPQLIIHLFLVLMWLQDPNSGSAMFETKPIIDYLEKMYAI